MAEFRIAHDFALPLKVVTMTEAWIGRKRSGKTYGAQKLAEEMLTHKQQVVVLDPTSA